MVNAVLAIEREQSWLLGTAVRRPANEQAEAVR
jgi:hypothetical protein